MDGDDEDYDARDKVGLARDHESGARGIYT